MFRAYAYLTCCSFKNRVRHRLRRLREPRYLIGTLIGIAYFALVFGRRGGGRPGIADARQQALLASIAGPLQFVGSLVLLLLAMAAWLVPAGGKALAFTRAEVQFLFTAPVTRRGLLHYKLLRSQLGMLVSSIVMTLLLRPGSLARGWTVFVGLWLVFVVLRLYAMAVALTRRSLVQHGASAVTRQWVPLTMVAGVLGVLVMTVVRQWTDLVGAPTDGALFEMVQTMGTTGPAGVVLAPFRAVVGLPMASTSAEFWQRFPVVLGIASFLYVWVLRSDAAFEEASAEHAERTATRPGAELSATARPGAQPFRLSAAGLPELAILWKNLIQLGRYASARTLLRVVPLLVVLVLMAKNSTAPGGTAGFIASLCMPLAGITILLGPQLLRNDLRQDLAHLPLLKTWPLSGAAIVRGAVLAPTVVLSAVAWIAVAIAAALASRLPFDGGTRATLVLNRASFAAAAALVAPAVILAQVLIHNAIAIVFPAWSAVGGSRARGLDTAGQRMVMLAGVMLALLLSIAPGALAAGMVFMGGRFVLGTTLIVLPALVFAVVVCGVCWVAAEVLGRVFARTDVTALEPAEE